MAACAECSGSATGPEAAVPARRSVGSDLDKGITIDRRTAQQCAHERARYNQTRATPREAHRVGSAEAADVRI
jgi:hypothetical protein